MDISSTPASVPRIARLIKQDIRRRALAEGTPYLTAAEVAGTLMVHPRSASRAMKLLAHEGVLVRKRGVGTFVGPDADVEEPVAPASFHIFAGATIQRRALRLGGLLEGLLVAGVQQDVQFNLLPEVDPAERAQRILDSAAPLGVILVHCGREVQQAVLASGVPAVVFGSVYADTARLASVDLDQRQVGRLMVQHARKLGARKLAVLMRDSWLPGDNALIDGVHEQLLADGNGLQLAVRSLPPNKAILASELRQLLLAEDRPQVVHARDEFYAQAVVDAAADLGLRVPDNVAVLASSVDRRFGDPELHLTQLCAELPYEEQAAQVGRMLLQLIGGERPEPDHVLLEVRRID